MILQKGDGLVPREIPVFDPGGDTLVPGQGMAADHHLIILRKIKQLIARPVIKGLPVRTDGPPLHGVLGHYGVELPFQCPHILRIVWKGLGAVTNRRPDIKTELFR